MTLYYSNFEKFIWARDFLCWFPDIWELYAKRASEYELPHLAGSGLQASQ